MNAWIKQRTEAGVIETPALQLDGNRVVPITTRSSMPIKSIVNMTAAGVSRTGGGFGTGSELAAAGVSAVVSLVTAEAPPVLSSTGHPFATGDVVSVTDGNYTSIIGNWIVNVVDADSFELVGADASEEGAFTDSITVTLLPCLSAAVVGAGIAASFLVRKLRFTFIADTVDPLDPDTLMSVTLASSPGFAISTGKLNQEVGFDAALVVINTIADFLKFAGETKINTFIGATASIVQVELTFWDDYALPLNGNDIIMFVQGPTLADFTSILIDAQLETITFAVEDDLSTV